MLGKVEVRLYDERITEQRRDAAQVARCVEEVGVVAVTVPGVREPGLQGRAVRREGQEREPDRQRERREEPAARVGEDVCIDDDKNIYVCQWNAEKTYPIKLERV